VSQLIEERALRRREKRHLMKRKAVGVEAGWRSSSALEMCMLGISPTDRRDL